MRARPLPSARRPSRAAVTTAWFVDKEAHDTSESEVHGAWLDQRPGLKHYHVAATNMPRLLRDRANANNSHDSAAFSHHEWYIDPVHYSLEAHTLQAWLLGRALALEFERASHRQPVTRAPRQRSLPPPLHPASTRAAMREHVSFIDFTDRGAGFRSALLDDGHGWRWVEAIKEANGNYVRIAIPPGELPSQDDGRGLKGKLGYVAQRSGTATFAVAARFRLGQLRVSYLRSYAHMGAANLTVSRMPAGELLHASILNGTWELPVSLYTTEVVDLPRSLFSQNESLRVQLSRLPHIPGGFTVYSIASY